MNHRAEHEFASYHLFYHGSGDLILDRLVLPVVRDLWCQRKVSRFFFIRYGRGGPHIRLRLLCATEHKEEVEGVLKRDAMEFFKHWPSITRLDGEIRRQNGGPPPRGDEYLRDVIYPNHSVVEIPFEPEVKRYGGPDLLRYSLDFFCISSSYVLELIGQQELEARSQLLAHGIRTLLRQALGSALSPDELLRLVAYAAPGNGDGISLLKARADQEFERRKEDYIGLVDEEIENSGKSEDRSVHCLLANAAFFLSQILRSASDSIRFQILGSQLHMTSNRMGLMNVEEVYLGQILRRALEHVEVSNLEWRILFETVRTNLDNHGEDGLEMLAEESLARLALSTRDEYPGHDDLREER